MVMTERRLNEKQSRRHATPPIPVDPPSRVSRIFVEGVLVCHAHSFAGWQLAQSPSPLVRHDGAIPKANEVRGAVR